MTEVKRGTSLHESTVQRAEELSASASPKKPKRRRAEARPRSSQVAYRKVDELVHKEALRLAGGDAARITILDDGTVLVR